MKTYPGKHPGFGRRFRLLTAAILLGIIGFGPAAFGESNLSGGETDVGVEVPAGTSPYVRTTDIDLESSGDASGTLTDISFTAFGLRSESEVDIENQGAVTVRATGGTAAVGEEVDTSLYATGINTPGGVSNSGAITINATSAAAIAEGGDEAYAYSGDTDSFWLGELSDLSTSNGIYTQGDVVNSGGITVDTRSGAATATADQKAVAYSANVSAGIHSRPGDISNSGEIAVSVTTGDVNAASENKPKAVSKAMAVGILDYGGNTTNSGNLSVGITSGDAAATGGDATVKTTAIAFGIFDTDSGVADAGASDTIGVVENSGDITLSVATGSMDATGSDTADAESTVWAYGIGSGGNAGTAEGTAGMDTVDVFGNIDNTGDILLDIDNGAVTASGNGDAEISSFTYAAGLHATGNGKTDIYGEDAFGNIGNEGDITLNISMANAAADAAYDPDAPESAITAHVRTASQVLGIKASGSAESDSGETIAADADGVDTYGTVTNSGAVSINAVLGDYTADAAADGTAQASAYASAGIYAAGIDADGEDESGTNAYGNDGLGAVSNSGAISVIATVGSATATASSSSGDYASANIVTFTSGIQVSGDALNTGDIFVSATSGPTRALADNDASAASFASANGLGGGDDVYFPSAGGDDGSAAVTNSGTVTVSANAGDAAATAGSGGGATIMASATGIGDLSLYDLLLVDGDDELATTVGDVENSGAVAVSAAAGNAVATGDSRSSTSSYTEAVGIFTEGRIDNSADITANADAGDADATGETVAEALSYAVASGLYGGGEITNTGNIAISAVAGDAAATATGETETAAAAFAGARARGIFSMGGAVANSGDITAIATAGSATHAWDGDGALLELPENSVLAAGICTSGESDVVNSGNITVTAASETETAHAYGIFLQSGGSLTNTGIIRADGDRAYEVAVESGTLTLETVYNMTLDGDPAVGSIGITGDAVIDINDTVLTLTMTESTLWDAEYRIFEIESDAGAVTGAFGGFSAIENLNVAAVYHDQGTAGSGDDAVSLVYAPFEGGSALREGAGVMRQTAKTAFGLINQRLFAVYLDSLLADAGPFSGLRLYADSGAVVSDAGWGGRADAAAPVNGFSLTPYYASLEKDPDPVGYNADVTGVVASYDRQLSGRLFGFHLGYGRSDIDYTGAAASNSSEDQDFFTAGVHGMTALGKWTLRGQLAGFTGSHEYRGVTGIDLELSETADYDTGGVGVTLVGGYPLTYGGHMLLPEAGLEYLWSETDGFTTDSGDEMWNITSDALSENQVAATASLGWLTHRQTGGLTLIPSASVGLRQLLTDEATATHQTIGGSSPFTVEAVQNKTSGTASASLKLGRKNLSGEIAYLGEFGDVTTLHEVRLKLNYDF